MLPDLYELRARLAEREGEGAQREAALREAMALHQSMGALRQVERIEALLAS